MRLRHIYLALCVIGALLPYSQFIPWLAEHGLDFPVFFEQLFANRIGGFFGLDVAVCALVVSVFVLAEGKRLRIHALWLPIVFTLIVGPSLGLPLFLYVRQLHLDKTAGHPAGGTAKAIGSDRISR